MADTIDLNATSQPQTIDLSQANQPSSIPLSDDVVDEKAKTASFGLTDRTGITEQQFKDSIAAGNENTVRVEAADAVNKTRVNMAKDVIARYGRHLPDNALQSMLKASDPNSVVEEHYADSWMQHINWTKDPDKNASDSWYPSYATLLNEQGVDNALYGASSGIVAKNEYLRSQLQNIAYNNTWYNRGSFALQMAQDYITFGGYSELALRQKTAGTPLFAGIGLGEHLNQQRINLFNLDFDNGDFQKEVTRVLSGIPRDEQGLWLSSILDRSGESELMYNTLTYALGLGGSKAALKGSTSLRGVLTTEARNAAFDRTMQAYSDMTRPRNPNIPPSVAAPAQAGNVAESALHRVQIDAINELNPNNNPYDGWKRRAQGLFDVDGKAASDDPGALGREMGNRIKDYIDSSKVNFIDTVTRAIRVDPNPTATILKEEERIQRELAGKHIGQDNTILNMSHGIQIPAINVRVFNIATGTPDADLFKSIEQAKSFARNNGWAIKGDYAVSPAERLNLVRKENAIKGLLKQANPELPPVEPGYVRFYHGGDNPTSGGARWVSQDFKYARDYRTGVDTHYVDVPESWLQENNINKRYDDTGLTEKAKYVNFEIPEKFAKNMKFAYSQKAAATAEKLQKELDAVPRHTTGVTIESQRRYTDPMYSGPIGPRQPGPTPVVSPKTPSSVKPETPTKSYNRLKALLDSTPETPGIEEALSGKPKVIAETSGVQDTAEILRSLETNDLGDIPVSIRSKFTKPSGRILTRQEIEDWAKANPDKNLVDMLDELKPGWNDSLKNPITFPEGFIRTKSPQERSSTSGKFLPKEGGPRTMSEAETWKYIKDSFKENYPEKYNDTFKQPEVKTTDIPEPTIVQQGTGYYLHHTIYLPEEAKFVKDGILTNKLGELSIDEYRRKLFNGEVSTGIPDSSWAGSWLKATLGRFIGPGERLSLNEVAARQIATTGPNVLLKLVQETGQPLTAKAIPRKYWNDFNRAIKYTQQAWNDELKKPGIYWNNASEMNDFYQRAFSRSPTQGEVMAYFAYKTLALEDLAFRELAVMRRKIVMGAEQHAVRYLDPEGNKAVTKFFEGVQEHTKPDYGRVIVINSSNAGKSKVNWANRAFQGPKGEALWNDIEQGRANLIHVFNPKDKPMRDISPRYVDYVVAYNTEKKPLGFEHVNRTGGGHLIPEGEFYIKSADVDVDRDHRVYNGDNTVVNFKTRYAAEEAKERLEPVRLLLKQHRDQLLAEQTEAKRLAAGEEKALMRWEGEGGRIGSEAPEHTYLNQAAEEARATGLPFSKIYEWYFGKNEVNPRLSLDEPLHVVKSGQKIIDLGPEGADLNRRHPGLIDATKEGTLLSKAMTAFTQEKDMEGLYTLKNIGTEQNPLFKYEPADFVDPITAINRGLNRITDSMYMYDMKQYSMNHWLKQAAPYLDVKSEDELWRRAQELFYKPQYKPGITNRIQGLLESNRLTAHDFIGTPSVWENWSKEIAQGLADSIYRNTGFKLDSLYNLPKLSDGTKLIRNIGFYASQIGLKALWTQAASLNNILWVAGPRQMYKGTSASALYGYWKTFSGNPEALKGLDENLVKYFKWKPGEFQNAVKFIENSGFGLVGREHAEASNARTLGFNAVSNVTPWTVGLKTAQAYGKSMLDWGSFAFAKGSEVTRRSAFFTSYLEHLDRGLNTLDRNIQSSIIRRATLLDANMTSAMSSKLHTGAMSIPMQFQAYEIRMSEMMYGKNLTPQEKMRLFAGNSALYGLRGGYFALLGLPVGDYLVRKLQENGYVQGQNGLYDLLINGFFSWAFAYLGGFTTPDGKPTWNDFSNWGNRGMDAIDNFMDHDKSMLEMVAGMSGNKLMNTWTNSQGVRRDIWSMATGNDNFKLDGGDALQLFKELSVVDDINKDYLAFKTGEWFSKNGEKIGPVSNWQTAIHLIFGAPPMVQKEVWSKTQSIKDIEENLKSYEKQYNMYITRGLNSDSDSERKENFTKANALLKMYVPPEQWGQWSKRAIMSNQDAIDRVNNKLFLKEMNNPELLQNQRQ